MNIDLRLGDCIEVLKTIPDNSIDSIVTDPPYGLGFMGKEWDTFDKSQFGNIPDECSDENVYNKKGFNTLPRYKTDGLYQFAYDWATECLRVLKPGGHLLSFAGSRTYHKICIGIEDAGFEIRDQIMWVYGSGFPKSHNIGKAIDKIEGNEREDLGYNLITPRQREKGSNRVEWKTALERPIDNEVYGKDQRTLLERMKITKGNSQWEGWGTALKPAHEPIVMARKPLSEKSIAENVLKHGTGGINIDGSRIEFEDTQNAATNPKFRKEGGYKMPEPGQESKGVTNFTSSKNEYDTSGRWPANIIFDEEAGKLLDEQSGISKSTPSKGHHRKNNTTGDNRTPKAAGMFGDGNWLEGSKHNDVGGASRFFYCPKASKKDKNEGLDNFEDKALRVTSGGTRDYNARCANCGKKFIGPPEKICDCDEPVTDNQVFKNKNNHPTVKPTDLMRYLINLVTPKGGTTLDPFMGSGSTGKAAVKCGVNFIGIEKEEEYMKIAEARINHEKNKPIQQELF